MSDFAGVPGITEPVIETKTYADGASATGVAPLPDVSPTGAPAINAEAGTAAAGESNPVPAAAEPTPANATDSAAASQNQTANGAALDGTDPTPAVLQEGTSTADSINLGAHLSRLDGMLAELERKIAAGIHTFAHEITAARDHLAKLL
ncbi:TPA: hypothetical protein SAO52_003676 [Burkholderia vietnamiensis]|nr:hypothetical protein [Burkholderia vietnamiensis]